MLLVAIISVLVIVMETTCSARRMRQEYKLLNDGHRIPSLACGTWQNVTDLDVLVPALTYAIEVGFKHVDTAHLYVNEHLIGRVLADVFKRRIVTREDMFITTKASADIQVGNQISCAVWAIAHTAQEMDIRVPSGDMVIPSLKRNLRRLKLDYVDLFLIHSPFNVFDYPKYDILNIWRGMEDAKRLNLTRSIGVSNFNSSDINRLLRHAKIRPAVNEIQVHLTYTNLDLVAYCQSQGIVVMAYPPFGFMVSRPFVNFTVPPTFEDPKLKSMARKYGKQTSQVALRYLMDRCLVPIPKSLNRTHILSNVDIFDFNLSRNEVLTMNDFNKNTPVYPIDKDMFRTYYEYVKSVVPKLL